MLNHNKKTILITLLILSCLLTCTLEKRTKSKSRSSSSYSSKKSRSSSTSFWGFMFTIFNFFITFIGYSIAGCCCCCCAGCWCLKKIGERNPQRIQEILRDFQNRQRERERRRGQQRQRERQRPLPYKALPQITEDAGNNPHAKLNWRKAGSFKQAFKNGCTICLEQNPSIELQCGHFFHRNCVIQSIRQKEECPVCRSVHFNHIRVHCQRCFEWYFEATLLERTLALQIEMQICDICSFSHQAIK